MFHVKKLNYLFSVGSIGGYYNSENNSPPAAVMLSCQILVAFA